MAFVRGDGHEPPDGDFGPACRPGEYVFVPGGTVRVRRAAVDPESSAGGIAGSFGYGGLVYLCNGVGDSGAARHADAAYRYARRASLPGAAAGARPFHDLPVPGPCRSARYHGARVPALGPGGCHHHVDSHPLASTGCLRTHAALLSRHDSARLPAAWSAGRVVAGYRAGLQTDLTGRTRRQSACSSSIQLP